MVIGATRKDQGWNKVAVYLTTLTDRPYPAPRNHGCSWVTDPLVHSIEVIVRHLCQCCLPQTYTQTTSLHPQEVESQ